MESSFFAHTILVRADFSETSFRGRLWSSPDFLEANAKDSKFRKCYMNGVSMTHVNLENADFTDTYLELVEMSTGNLKNTNFSRCYFNKFNICDATLTNTNFSDSKFVGFIQASDAKFKNVNFTGAKGKLDKFDYENTIYEKTGLPLAPYIVITDEDVKHIVKPKKKDGE